MDNWDACHWLAKESDRAVLVDTVRELAQRAEIGMPQVAIFEGAPNAFATGAFKNSALDAFGKDCLNSPFVFSLEPRCHGCLGSQKYTAMSVAMVNRLCPAISVPRSQVSDL
jgi:Zn-dependent protease with chaperone function